MNSKPAPTMGFRPNRVDHDILRRLTKKLGVNKASIIRLALRSYAEKVGI